MKKKVCIFALNIFFTFKYQIMKSFLYMTFCALLISSCQNESKPIQNLEKKVDSVAVAPQTVYERPTFLSTTTTDSMDTPHSIVSFAFGTAVEKLDTVTGSFALLDPVEIKQMKLPKSYIVVGKAFWAGLQVVLAIDSTAKGYIVKKQYEDEGSTGKEPFEVVKSFPK